MKYTTTESLARRLRGRLQIENQPVIDATLTNAIGYGSVVAGNTVDPQLIVELAEQKESYIDLILGQIYVTPLCLVNEVTRNILKDLSESLTISALIQVHFEGTNPVLQASDVSQASMDLRRNAEYMLQALTAGHNIWIPTAPGLDQSTQQGQRQPLRLPGEKLLGSDALPDTITRNYTVTTTKDFKDRSRRQEGFFNNDRSNCGPCSSNRVYGLEPYRECI
jgi:hypothetical protein